MSAKAQIPCGMDDFVELGSSILDQDVHLRFQARGYSMAPTIQDGDVIWVAPARQARIGDVVFLRTGSGRVVAHRVVRKIRRDDQELFQTRGDACQRPDGPASSEQLLGRIVCVERARDDKTVRLDGWRGRWTGLLWARLPRYTRWIYRLLVRLRPDCSRVLSIAKHG